MTEKFDNHSAPTRLLKQKKTVVLGGDNKIDDTEIVHEGEEIIPSFRDDTVLINDDPTLEPISQGNEATVLFRGKTNTTSENSDGDLNTSNEVDELPVTGWLVIVDGPGKGQSMSVNYGIQSIGRSDNQDIIINFGDNMISREKHAKIIYEPNKNKFLLAPGEGKNIPYLNDEDIYVLDEATEVGTELGEVLASEK